MACWTTRSGLGARPPIRHLCAAICWVVCLLCVGLGAPGPGQAPGALARVLGLHAAASLTAPQPAQIAIVPSAGPPQSSIALAGTGFSAGDRIAIVYSDPQNQAQPLGTVTVGADGSIQATKLTIPPSAAPGGMGILLTRDTANPASSPASAVFAVTPLATILNVDPSVAAAGDTISVDGAGFEPGTPVHLQMFSAGNTAPFPLSTTSITSTGTGTFGPVAITLPSTLPTGQAVLNAVDAAGNVAGIPLTVLLTDPPEGGEPMQLRPPRTVLGAQVRFAAGGFTPGEPVTLTLTGADGESITAVPSSGSPGQAPPFGATTTPTATSPSQAMLNAPLVADNAGHVQGIVTVPLTGGVVLAASPSTAGSSGGTVVLVSARGAQSSVIRTSPLVITGPGIQIFPATTVPGHPYTLVGSGFAAGEVVSVSLVDSQGAVTQIGHYTAANCGDPGAAAASGQAVGFAGAPAATARCMGGAFTAVATAPRTDSPSGTSNLSYRLIAGGQLSGLSANARLVTTDAPALTLQHYVVAPGQSVLLHGNAFVPNATVTVQAGFPFGATMIAATDSSGSFTAALTVPLAAAAGPIAIQAQDRAGDQATIVLTVNNQMAAVHVPRLAQPGQVLTVRGSGFASGETVDIFLAEPGSASGASGSAPGAGGSATKLQPLPDSTLTTTADALGSFVASYPLPAPIVEGPYLVGVSGETSQLQAVTAFVIGSDVPASMPTPTPCVRGSTPATLCSRISPTPIVKPTTPPPTPCPTLQPGTRDGACSIDAVTYFAEGSTAQVTTSVAATQAGNAHCSGPSCRTGIARLPCTTSATAPAAPGAAATATPAPHGSGTAPSGQCLPAIVSFREKLYLLNDGDQPATVEVAYLIYGLASPLAGNPPGGRSSSGWTSPSGGGNLQLLRTRALVLAPHATQARSVNADIGDGHLVSIIVRAAGPVKATVVMRRVLVVERPQGCTASRPCPAGTRVQIPLDAAGSMGTGLANPSTTWLFAEGYLGGAVDDYLNLLNPQDGPATVQIRFLGTRGPLLKALRITVPAVGRQSVDVRQVLQTLCTSAGGKPGRSGRCPPSDQSLGVQLSSSIPIVAERSLYWGTGPDSSWLGTGPARAGFDIAPGATQPLRAQSFAYASTIDGDQAYLSILDPAAKPATVTVSIYSDSGMRVARKMLRVGAQERATLSIGSVVYPGVYALGVTANVAVIDELAQYVGGSPQTGAHAGWIEPGLAPTSAGKGAHSVSGGGFDVTASASGSTANQNTQGSVVVRVYNPAATRMEARIATNTPAGAHPAGQYQVAANATLQIALPIPTTPGAGHAPQPIGATVTCSGPCVSMALTGAQGPTAKTGYVNEMWGIVLR